MYTYLAAEPYNRKTSQTNMSRYCNLVTLSYVGLSYNYCKPIIITMYIVVQLHDWIII